MVEAFEKARFERLDEQGAGLGTSEDGSSVVVRGALPQEQVLFEVEHVDQNGLKFGRLVEVEQTSADRVEVPCRKFLRCGGCDLLHLDDEAELHFKRAKVARALGLPLERVDAVMPSPRSLHYRAVAKFVFGPGGRLGSYAPRSHVVVDMMGCKVHAPVIERVADTIRRAAREGMDTAGARYLVLRAAVPREVVHATLVVSEAGLPAESSIVRKLASNSEVAEVWRHLNATEGDAIIDPSGQTTCLHRGSQAVGQVGTAQQHLATGAFSQVNPGAAERLYQRVTQLVEPSGRRVLDLYSGSGGIALTLATHGAHEVLGIEHTPAAVQAARRSAQPFGDRLRFEVGGAQDVERFLQALGAEVFGGGGGFSAWVVNPPRKGLNPEVVQAVLRHLPERLIYVSCHPDRLARDLSILAERYEIDVVTPVDMFPQTHHVETVVRLRLVEAGP